MHTIKKRLHGNSQNYFIAIVLGLFMNVTACSDGYATGKISAIKNSIPPPIEWVLDKTVSNVDFYHAITACNDKNVVFLKFVNRNSTAVKISWKEIFVTKANEQKNGFAGKKVLNLAPGTTTPADCSDVNNRQAIITSSDVDPTSIVDISNFIYEDITVNNQ